MKRIFFFIESLSGGGAEKVLVTLLKYLDYNKYNVTLLTLVDVGVLKDEINLDNVCYRSIIKKSFSSIERLWNKVKYKLIYNYIPTKLLNKWIIPSGFDVYIAFIEGFSTKLISYSKGKKVAWVHADLGKDPWTIEKHIFKNISDEKNVYNSYDKVISVSQSLESVMTNYYCLRNVLTIYNPIDSNDIIKQSKERTGLDFPLAFNIISVGRLVPQKGYDKLIPIIARLFSNGYNIRLYILGEGPERCYLEKIIKEENVDNIVHLLGYQKNPYSIMKQMNLFVCSSRAEGYSLVIAEAIVLGLPVISMNCAGPNELLEGGKYGSLCDDYDALEASIEKAISDRDYYQDLRKKSSMRQSFFSVSNTIEQIDELIDSL